MGKEMLTLRDVSKYYTSGQSVVMGLNSINLSFEMGEFVAITGESGSGKSTLAKVMAGILPYENGEMLVGGRPTSHYDGSDWERYRGESIGFISQSYDILPGCSVLRNVVSALRLTGMEKGEATVRAEEILKQVELWDLKKRRAAKLSSGQKQRLSIARALAKPAPVLIADEPTGNLDPENSAKVIELLSAAARDRLVIMITHEFDEAADHATRRIVLRNGVVVSDVNLRPAKEEGERKPCTQSPEKTRLGFYTARLQMGARPVWSAVMLLFFALTAFAVFAFLGTFIVNLDDSSTRIYDTSAFRNGDPERIAVLRPDGARFTQEDFDRLLGLENVERLERYGYVTDVSYYYRDNVDVFYHYNSVVVGLGEVKAVTRDITLEGNGLFLKTVPLTASDTGFLTAGRLPETMYEVVAVGGSELIGQRFPVYVRDAKNWNRTAYLLFTVEVVGVTDQGEHLYFSEQLGRSLTAYAMPDDELKDVNGEQGLVIMPYEYDALIDERLLNPPEGVVYQLPDYYYNEPILNIGELEHKWPVFDKAGNPILDENGNQKTVSMFEYKIEFMCNEKAFGSVSYRRVLTPEGGEPYFFSGYEASGFHGSTYQNALTVAADAFDLLVSDEYGDQVSLFITDFAYTERVLEELSALDYRAASPYSNGTTKQDPELAAERMQTLKVCLLALVAAILLQVVVLRAMFSVETEEFRLLANLGLNRHTARRSVFWQALLFGAGGQVLAFACLFICRRMRVERIVSMLHYLPWPYLILLSAVHFAASMLTALWVMGAVRRQVFPFAGQRYDLKLDDTDWEVSE